MGGFSLGHFAQGPTCLSMMRAYSPTLSYLAPWKLNILNRAAKENMSLNVRNLLASFASEREDVENDLEIRNACQAFDTGKPFLPLAEI